MMVKSLTREGSLIKPPRSEKIKSGLVFLKKGEEVGEHITDNREEVIIILQGEALVILENQKRVVKENNLIFIPKNKKHNIKNKYNKILKYIYVVSLLNK